MTLKRKLPLQKNFLLVNSLPLRLVRISNARDAASGFCITSIHTFKFVKQEYAKVQCEQKKKEIHSCICTCACVASVNTLSVEKKKKV